MKVLFLHGLEGSATGQKPTWLRAAGYDVVAPTLDTSVLIAHLEALRSSVDEALRHDHLHEPLSIPSSTWTVPLATASAALREHPDVDVVVGSSFGGGLALELVRLGRWSGPVVVLAPAGRKLFGITSVRVPKLAILHGRRDDVVPLADSVALANDVDADDVILRVVDDDHRLSASVARGLMGMLIEQVTATP